MLKQKSNTNNGIVVININIRSMPKNDRPSIQLKYLSPQRLIKLKLIHPSSAPIKRAMDWNPRSIMLPIKNINAIKENFDIFLQPPFFLINLLTLTTTHSLNIQLIFTA